MKVLITLIAMLTATCLSAQFDTSHTFYNLTPNKVDLHYHLKWSRSSATVVLNNGKMTTPKNEWFQTGPTKLTGYGYISNDYRVTNSSGTSKLKIELIDTLTGITKTKLDTLVTSSTINNSTLYLNSSDTGVYYIRYTFVNPSGNSQVKLEMSSFTVTPYVALPIKITPKRKETKVEHNEHVKVYHSDNTIKLIIEESNEYEWSIYSIDGKLILNGSGVSNGVVNIPYEFNSMNIIVINALGFTTSHKI